jgi:hypothetical protein
MAIRKRSTRSNLTDFQIRRVKVFRANPAVPLAVERFAGKSFCYTWRLFKFAVFDQPLKRRRGSPAGSAWSNARRGNR